MKTGTSERNRQKNEYLAIFPHLHIAAPRYGGGNVFLPSVNVCLDCELSQYFQLAQNQGRSSLERNGHLEFHVDFGVLLLKSGGYPDCQQSRDCGALLRKGPKAVVICDSIYQGL